MMKHHYTLSMLSLFMFLFAVAPLVVAEEAATEETYDKQSVLEEVTGFFGEATESVAKVVERIFDELGEPNAYIKGNEASGAFIVGARYGDGVLQTRAGENLEVHWTGPSVGFDAGGNVSKVFVLVYHLPNADTLFKRYPAVDGSFYLIGGVSANYHRRDGVILAPIRLGAGLRSGVNIGYMHYTREKKLSPF